MATAPETTLLRLSGVEKRYGGVRALGGVDFEVHPGEVHALVGENGAGKSTLVKIIAGAERLDVGTIVMNGLEIGRQTTQSALAAGIATVYQEPHLFGELTVTENVFLGREKRGRFGIDWESERAEVRELLDGLGLSRDLADVRAADLSAAERQLVSIAKSGAYQARLLILDEPSAILTDREIQTLFEVVRGVRRSGVGVIYISHRLDELERIADRVTVLRDGAVVVSRPMEDLSTRQVAELMVGHEVDASGIRRTRQEGATKRDAAPVLSARGLARRGQFSPIDVDVRGGEVVALYGLVGSGTGAILRAVYGVDPAEEGAIVVDGTSARPNNPREAADLGIGMVPADRAQQGVFANKSIAFNVGSSHLRRLVTLPGWLDRAREHTVTTELIERLRIRAPGPRTPVSALSGGNQQKTLIARQLVAPPRVLLSEEPTQGVDVAAKEEIHRIIDELAEAGSAVLIASADLPEVLSLADRLLVVRRGRIVTEFAAGARQAEVLAAAAGAAGEATTDDRDGPDAADATDGPSDTTDGPSDSAKGAQ